MTLVRTASPRAPLPRAQRPRLALTGGVLVAAGLLLTAPAGGAAQAILNVERLQPGDVQGWHSGIEGEFSFSRGNSEYLDFLTGLVLGHRWRSDWLRVFVGLDYRSETGEGLENDRYLHARYNHWWGERLQSFHFIQYQASHSGFQELRALVGSGLRRRLVDGTTTFDVGTGVMYEREELDAARITDDHPSETDTWRMANLVVATHQLTEAVRLLGVGYIQPDLSDWADLRTLTDLSLQVALTAQVSLTVRGEWRRDGRPPGGREGNDVVMRSGITVSFR